MTQLADPVATSAIRTPYTGESYLESLRDGREIWLHGERVADVTSHPAFRNTARTVARLYDAMHDPANRGTLAVPTDTGNGGFTHPSFKANWTQDDLRTTAKGIEAWARISYGWLGRSPDYKAGFLSGLGNQPELFGEYADNARRWYVEAQETAMYANHAIVNPPIDRDLGPDGARDVFMRVEEETDAGLIISGAKVVATNAALTHCNLVSSFLPPTAKEYSATFICPMGTPGVKLICRTSYELNAALLGGPFDYPLSSRFDENDSILVLDKVLIPWENVLAYDVDQTSKVMASLGPRAILQGCIRLAVKFDFLVGLLIKGLEMTGTSEFRGVQTRVGELMALRNLFWTCVNAMVEKPVTWVDGTLVPNPDAGPVYRLMMTQAYPRAREIFMQDLAGALVYLPSSAHDFNNADLRPFIDRFVRGSGDKTAEERVKLLKLIWDAIGSEFGGRHELYELNYSGNHELIRLQTYMMQQQRGQVAEYKTMVETFMSEYDLNGWTAPDLVNNHDVSIVSNGYLRNVG